MTWRVTCGNGQVVAILALVIMAGAFSAAAGGAATTTTVLSRAGTTSARAARATTAGFVFVVEFCFAWIFRYPLYFVLLPC